jgi:hypothetical protein
MRALLLAVAATLLLASPAAATPAWLPPVDLGAETLDPSSIGRVAVGADGTAVAAWAQSVPGPNWELQVARRRPGEGYGAPITVPATTGAGSVRVGVDGTGNATILYELGGGLVVLPWPAASAEPGAKQPLEAGGSPELAVGRGGTAVATWIENPSSTAPRVRAAVRSGTSGDFGAAVPLSDIGNGLLSITGLRAAVGDAGHVTVAWSRTNGAAQTVVEANERAPGSGFVPSAFSISNTLGGAATEPAVAVDAAGRSTVLWTNAGANEVRFAEHAAGQANYSGEARASQAGAGAHTPVAAAAPNGAVVAAWVSNGAMEAAARPAGGAFADFRTLSGPSMDSFQPLIAVGANGDAVIAWLVGDGSAVFTVQRKANGTYGPLLTAVNNSSQPPGEFQHFFEPSISMDDQGNGVAAWTRDAFHDTASHYRVQSASFDAAAPALSSSVPPGAQVGAPIGMAAAASDRVSPVAIAWNFGDGSTAAGGAVSHAFGSAGAFNVTVTATDAAGNQASQAHPVLIAASPPPRPKRIRSAVSASWGLGKRQLFLLRLQVSKVPKGGKVELRCSRPKKVAKCPFKRKSSKHRRKGNITLFKQIKAAKVVGKKQRTFFPGQRLELRITAKGYIGKVVRYKLKKGKIPSGKQLCLPDGAKKPRKRC